MAQVNPSYEPNDQNKMIGVSSQFADDRTDDAAFGSTSESADQPKPEEVFSTEPLQAIQYAQLQMPGDEQPSEGPDDDDESDEESDDDESDDNKKSSAKKAPAKKAEPKKAPAKSSDNADDLDS